MNKSDASQKLSDYALDLLPMAEKEQLRRQMMADPTLLPRLQYERQVATLVRQTLTQAGQSESDRLANLMPPAPAASRRVWWRPMSRQLALAAILCLLLLVGWRWLDEGQAALWPAPPTEVAATATVTQTPEATETRLAPNALAAPTAAASVAEPVYQLAPPPKATPATAVGGSRSSP